MARKPLLLKNVSDAERGLAYTLTSSYLSSADTTSDLVYFTVDAYEKADALEQAMERDDVKAANIREYINYLVSGAISQRYEQTV